MNTTQKVIYIIAAFVILFLVGFIPPTCQKNAVKKEFTELKGDYEELKGKYEQLEHERVIALEFDGIKHDFRTVYTQVNEKNFGNAKTMATTAFNKIAGLKQRVENDAVKNKLNLILNRKSSIIKSLDNTESTVAEEINDLIIDHMTGVLYSGKQDD